MEPRFAFNDEAGLYEAARAAYPAALFADVIAATSLTRGARLLEIGCGTGQATLAFAQIGYDILALDPGGDLIARARDNLAGHAHVRFVQATFEDWPLEARAFDLVFSAQAFHWVAPELRFVKAAAALADNGALAVFGSAPVGLDERLRGALQGVYERYASWGPPPEAWYLPEGPVRALFEESALYEAVTHKAYRWARSFTTGAYVDFLRTRSDHITMAPAQRDNVLSGVAAAIEAAGGGFEMHYETHLYLARKRA